MNVIKNTKKKKVFSIKLKTEEDFLGKSENIKMLGVNQMFRFSPKAKKIVLTNEGKKYKKFLNKKALEIREELKIKKALDNPIMIYVKIFINYPLTKDSKIDERYVRDVDNFFKPLQDSLQGENAIWKDDKIIKFIGGQINENIQEDNEFIISIINVDTKIIDKFDKIFL